MQNVKHIKDQIEKIEEAYEYTTERMIKNLKADDAKEGISAFVNKRDPKWKNS